MRVLSVAFLSALGLEIAATISTAIIAVEIGLRLLYGGMPFQPAFFVLLLAPEFYMPFRSLGTCFHAAMNGGAAATRILNILETPTPTELAEPESVPSLAHHAVVFDNVSYVYNGVDTSLNEERTALRDISFTLEPGKKLALVGPTGSGKSTVAHLLLRFIEPTEGSILVNGKPLPAFSSEEWRKQIAWVPQNPHLFNGTVAENLMVGKPGASQDQIEAAARVAHAHDFIMALPQGYGTFIGERGARLSGGQAQRLGLARAFLKDAPLLILDEATSNLDPKQEALVTEAIERLMHGRTVLAIAHRLSTVTRADTVIVLDEGRIVETGTHAALSGEGGMYGQMISAYAGSALH
jgi:ATP-binding cassette subfamily C protein CydD